MDINVNKSPFIGDKIKLRIIENMNEMKRVPNH